MILNIFSKHKNKNPKTSEQEESLFDETKYYLALDIGTEVLKGLVFSMHNVGVDIWASYHLKQQVRAMRSGVILDKELIVQNAKMVIHKLKEQLSGDITPERVVLGLAGELINGISITVDYDRAGKVDSPISEQEAEFIKESIFARIENHGKKELANRIHTKEEDVDILHLSITGFELDGKAVDSIVGSKARNVRVFIYASFAPHKYIEILEEIASRLGLEIGVIVVQPFAVASAYAGLQEKQFSGIFVDIGGGTTDVALVENSSRIQTQMYAFGGRAFTNRIAKEFKLPLNLAEERKLKYSQGQLNLDLKDQMRQVIIPDVRLWIDSLKIALQEMDTLDEHLPSNFYLCGGGALLPDIKEIMLAYPWPKHLPFAEQPKIKVVTPDMLDRVYDKTGLLVNPYDVTPASLARFYWDTIKRADFHKIRNKIEA